MGKRKSEIIKARARPVRAFLLNELQECFDLAVGDIFLVGLVVDGEQKNGIISHVEMGDHPGSTGFALSLGSNGQTYFIAVIAESSTGSGISGKLATAPSRIKQYKMKNPEGFTSGLSIGWE